ncbi:uncharacterized protein LOC130710203 [Lotus japonicus]|uniref:uncharacterized protein LOC130710203 n=1 Tax=Lotus japonicus TaxID=34305 RepID=UPI002587B425|nr:uncharacterized protein LOC130710203 [Lotus japonicus]
MASSTAGDKARRNNDRHSGRPIGGKPTTQEEKKTFPCENCGHVWSCKNEANECLKKHKVTEERRNAEASTKAAEATQASRRCPTCDAVWLNGDAIRDCRLKHFQGSPHGSYSTDA